MKIELTEKRTLNSKTFQNDDGSFSGEFHTGHIHYLNKTTGKLEDINTDLVDKGNFWEMRKAGYEVELPKKSVGTLKFKVGNDNFDAVFLKVNGQIAKNVDGILTAPYQITYPEVLPDIDFVITCGHNSFRKEIVIKQKPIFTGDFFEIEFQTNGNFTKTANDKFKQGEIHFRKAIAKDSAKGEIGIELEFKPNTLIKKIPREFLENAIYPVWTDDSTAPTSGAGDGHIRADNATWATCQGAAAGDAAAPTATGTNVDVYEASGVYHIYRVFLPFDTSAIPAGSTITATTLTINNSAIYDSNDGYDWVNVVETSQPDHTTLAVADYDLCGDAIDNPTEGATRIDFTGQGVGNMTWTLDATGRGWVKTSGQSSTCGASLTGWTCLGLRVGNDCLDVAIAAGNETGTSTRTSEFDGNDPVLDVTYTLPSVVAVRGFMTTNSKYWG